MRSAADHRPLRSTSLSPVRLVFGALCLAVALAPTLSAVDEDLSPEESRLRRAAQLRGMALAEMEDANYGLAVQHLEALAKILPDNILPPVNLAICHFRLNQPDKALESLRRAQEIAPDNPQLLYTLARVLEQENPEGTEWTRIIEEFKAAHPRDVRPFYLRAEQLALAGDWAAAADAFRQAIRRDPENLVLLVEHLVASAEARDADQTLDALYAIEDRLNGFEGNLVEYADRLLEVAEEGQVDAMRPPALVLRNLLRPTELYQLGLVPLTGGQVAGGQMFPQLDFSPALPKSIQGGQDIAVSWINATSELKLEKLGSADRLLTSTAAAGEDLLFIQPGKLLRVVIEESARIEQQLTLQPAPVGIVIHRDIDQDHLPDLASAHESVGVLLYRGQEDGTFADGDAIFASPGAEAFLGLAPLDIDHDGDLDLFVRRAGAGDLYLQNNGDGSWAERASELGLDGGSADTLGVVSADFDDDGDLDLITLSGDGRPRLMINRRSGALQDASQSWGLTEIPTPNSHIETADFDKDGLFDLLLAGNQGGRILRNTGSRFEEVSLPESAPQSWHAIQTGDFDNDGDQDVLVAATEPGPSFLLRNRRSEFVTEPVPLDGDAVRQLVPGDFDSDGDLDIAVLEQEGSPLLWINQGGNRNQWLRLQLRGRSTNNSKNNTEGLFTRIELRIGDDFQAMLGNGRANHLGLGAARQADVIRVIWTNGLAQSWLQVGANRSLVEEQVLKGSCPFLYTWNGSEFEFVTDLMWRSPLGMTMPDGSAAAHESARDYVLIPGESLVPSGDEVWLQVTEELWEAVYVDRLQLIAVDHPVTTDLVIDEAFRPPPHPAEPPAHWLEETLSPTAASDQEGRDLLAQVLVRDEQYVDSLPLTRYQGLTEGHYLELEFDEIPTGERLRLVLWGWIFPTDSSINFALSQDSSRESVPPSLEIQQPDGSWRALLPFLGFPNGKRKAVVAELTDLLPSNHVRLRIPTTMQIYWDAAVLAVGDPAGEARWTRLDPSSADLHYRGYSRLYRQSESGPHLFDYSQVRIGPRFRDMQGTFTRFGDTTELLMETDDRYVVMNAGDEITVRFAASDLKPLPHGWRRDWILFTDGWVKDGDLHTAHSETVDPLPYHGMSAYPDRPEHTYPTSARHREYLERYQTRVVTDREFREAVRPPSSHQ